MVDYIKNISDVLKYEMKIDLSFMDLPSVGIKDIIDILIVAYIIYHILVWIKDTRAWTLFKGIIIILIVSAIAYVFQFNTVLWIFEKTINVGILAVIIVFQPELRRALEQLGRGNLISTFFINEEQKDKTEKISSITVEEIIKACNQMSKDKTGALIVIEQEVKLGEYERTGIPIDAKVTSQLVLNIFEHNTPLHDGAVMIRNNRITAATCFLPLSDNPNISKALGTRHRAALGLSEVSDSKVIIVSEETGTISMANIGVIKRNIDDDYIRKQLIYSQKRTVENKKFVLWKGRAKNE